MNQQILIDAMEKIAGYNSEREHTMYAYEIRQIATEALAAASQSTDKEEGDEKNLIIQGLEEGAELWKQEYDNCRAILQELADLKVIKDKIDNMPPYQQGLNSIMVEDYKRKKPLVWERAKEFLKTYQHGYE